MSVPVHRNNDRRSCGARTRVQGQSTVYVNNQLASVQGDPNTHGGGSLRASVNDGTVFINNKKLVLKGSEASRDRKAGFLRSRSHKRPRAIQASPNVFACGGGSGGSGFVGSPDEEIQDPVGSDLYPDPNAETTAGDGTELPRPITDSEYDPSLFSEADQARIAELENDPQWQAKLTEMEAKYPGLDRNQLYEIMNGESNFNPQAVNGNTGATGLFQFMPQSASELGYNTDQIYNMSPSQQLEVYDQYLGRWGYSADNHLGIMQAAPAYASRPANSVIYPVGSRAWEQNPGWRPSDGGHITVGSINEYYSGSA